jgi:cytidyltransferase-like protein
MSKIEKHGFYPGTFDPIHEGHLEIAKKASEHVDKVWLLPNPKKSKSKPNTLPLETRRDLVNIAIEGQPKISVPENEAWAEYEQAYHQHGVDEAITALSNHLGVKPVHIVGQDVYEKRPHKGRKVMVIPRGDNPIAESADVHVLPAVGDISSSKIREKLAKGQAVTELHPGVYREIKNRRLYENSREEIETQAAKKWILTKIVEWEKQFDPHEIKVELGGSLISGLFVFEGADKFDADVKFIVSNPEDQTILQKIESVTGLKYKKTLRIKELPPEKNTAVMMENTVTVPGLSLPIDIEGCVRQGPYINSHKFYPLYFSPDELRQIKETKKALRGNKEEYKKFKYEMRDELMRRINANS